MFKLFLNKTVHFVTFMHQFILSLNDKYGVALTDKQLHFIVIGVVGVVLLIFIFPLFKWLAKKNGIMGISWVYVFTILIVITFMIEIGQKITGTGDLDFADIVAGLLGFIVMSAIYLIIRKIINVVKGSDNK